MPEYLTTREVAQYLRLNEKKVYDLVAKGRLPAARVSGKWLFPKHLIDEWVGSNTVHPSSGLMGALLDEMLVIQGSDDWLFGHVAESYREREDVPVVSASIGSLAGLAAVAGGRAHMAGCHVPNSRVSAAGQNKGWYLLSLCERRQGLIFDGQRFPDMAAGMASLDGSMLRFAQRQPLSGTQALVGRCLNESGIDASRLRLVGPFASHLELALAIRRGEADVGMGTHHAAQQCGLDFVELADETYKLAVPLGYAGHPAVARFLEFLLDQLPRTAAHGSTGYSFRSTGKLETLVPDA
jgi:putative molybdopterin biosynthesis protein